MLRLIKNSGSSSSSYWCLWQNFMTFEISVKSRFIKVIYFANTTRSLALWGPVRGPVRGNQGVWRNGKRIKVSFGSILIFTSRTSSRGIRIGPVRLCVCVCACVCLSALSRHCVKSCDMAKGLWGKQTLQHRSREVRQRSGVFMSRRKLNMCILLKHIIEKCKVHLD